MDVKVDRCVPMRGGGTLRWSGLLGSLDFAVPNASSLRQRTRSATGDGSIPHGQAFLKRRMPRVVVPQL